MFSKILRDLRTEKRLSQKKLAEIVGVSPGNVSDWESGKTKPGYVALAALSRCFEVSADYLLELEPGKTGDKDEIYRLEEIKKKKAFYVMGVRSRILKRISLLCIVSYRPTFGRICLIRYIAYTVNTLNARGSLSTGHISKKTAKKATPLTVMKLRVEPLDFCRPPFLK